LEVVGVENIVAVAVAVAVAVVIVRLVIVRLAVVRLAVRVVVAVRAGGRARVGARNSGAAGFFANRRASGSGTEAGARLNGASGPGLGQTGRARQVGAGAGIIVLTGVGVGVGIIGFGAGAIVIVGVGVVVFVGVATLGGLPDDLLKGLHSGLLAKANDSVSLQPRGQRLVTLIAGASADGLRCRVGLGTAVVVVAFVVVFVVASV
jgi:hypothetical protein